MKKSNLLLIVFIGLLFVTACGSKGYKNKNTRTVEDLLDEYVEAYTTANLELAKDLFPPFYNEYAKEVLTQEKLDAGLKKSKEVYGDDFHITYEVTKQTKYTDEELLALNDKMATNYNSKDSASECYKIEGTITFAGSKLEDPDPLTTMAYCKYDDSWYLVGV